MTNLQDWRLASGVASKPKRRSRGASRRWLTPIVRDAPDELTSLREGASGSRGLGLVLAIGLSAALWAAIIGAGVILLR